MKKVPFLFFLFLLFLSCRPFNPNVADEVYHLRNNYAVRCMELGLFEESLFHLKYLLNNTNTNKGKNKDFIYNNMAIVYEYLGDRKEAAKFYKKASQISTEYKDVINHNLSLFHKNKEVVVKSKPRLRTIIFKKKLPPNIPAQNLSIIVIGEDEELNHLIKNIFAEEMTKFTINIIETEEKIERKTEEEIEDFIDTINEDICCVILVKIYSVAEDIERVYARRFGTFSHKEDRFIYQLPKYIEKTVKLELEVIAILAKEKRIKYKKLYKEKATATHPYSILYNTSAADYDIKLISEILKKPVKELIDNLQPLYKTYKRIAILKSIH